MKVFLDANVLFSAANSGSEMHSLFQELVSGYELITSDYAHEEAIRNIRMKRPSWIDDYSKLLIPIRVVQSLDLSIELPVIEKDRPILATALSLRCDYLVTGDKKDFGHLYGKKLGCVLIVSPSMMAEICENHQSTS